MGNGEWMTEWKNRMESYGATLISEGLTAESPEGEDEDKCKILGKLIAKIIIKSKSIYINFNMILIILK